MKNLLGSLLLAASMFCAAANSENLACSFIDLAGHEERVYEPFLELLKNTGFAPRYVGLHEFVDEDLPLDAADNQIRGIFVVLGADLLAHMNSSPIGLKFLQLVQKAADIPNFFIGYFLPNFNGVKEEVALLPALKELFAPLGISTAPVPLSSLEKDRSNPIAKSKLDAAALDFFLKNPIISRPVPFHTTLNLPRGGKAFASNLLTAAHKTNSMPLTLLPAKIEQQFSGEVLATLPYFMYTYAPVGRQSITIPGIPSASKKNKTGLHLLIGNEMLVGALGITEQFHIRPFKSLYVQEMLDLMGLGLAQFHSLVTHGDRKAKNFQTVVKHTVMPDLTQVKATLGQPLIDGAPQALAKVAWMEIGVFEPAPEHASSTKKAETALKQAELITYLFEGEFDGLWITFNPHQYWSKIARKKEQEASFLASIQEFTKQLAARAEQEQKPLPAILVGFEITNNIYAPNLPQNCATDSFSNQFNDIPSPLDKGFWFQEIIAPLEELAKRWQDPMLSHGIPLKGVVLDLEMYCRRRVGSFTPACGFDRETLGCYDPALAKESSVHAVVQKLMDQKKYSDFLLARTKKAEEIGIALKDATKLILGRDALLLCYAQNLMIDWFYKGLYRGLSSEKEPLGLLTFNVEFAHHKKWLQDQKIHLYHGCVALLSKFATKHDFHYIDQVMDAHETVWFNRVSRLIENYDAQSWVSLEQTPLKKKDKSALMHYLAAS